MITVPTVTIASDFDGAASDRRAYAEAEAIGEHHLAAEWRWELNTYRAAKKQAIDEQSWAGTSAVARLETLGKRRSEQP